MTFYIEGYVEMRPLYHEKVVLIKNENVFEPESQSTQKIIIPCHAPINNDIISNIQKRLNGNYCVERRGRVTPDRGKGEYAVAFACIDAFTKAGFNLGDIDVCINIDNHQYTKIFITCSSNDHSSDKEQITFGLKKLDQGSAVSSNVRSSDKEQITVSLNFSEDLIRWIKHFNKGNTNPIPITLNLREMKWVEVKD